MSSPPQHPPANTFLFGSQPGRNTKTSLTTTPSAVLHLLVTQSENTGNDLSTRSRITKIEYCKSSKPPYHEYLLVYIAYTLDGIPYPSYRAVAIIERNADKQPEASDTTTTSVHDPGPSSAVGVSVPATSSTSSLASVQATLDDASSNGSSLFVSSGRTLSSSFNGPANDIITIFPGDMEGRRCIQHKATMTFKEQAVLSFEQLASIVATVHEQAPTYRLPSTQCYWFSMCVWTIVCKILGDGAVYDSKEMKPMGKWRKDAGNHHVAYRMVNTQGEGRFVLKNEVATSLVKTCDQSWRAWRKKFADAARVKNEALARKDETITNLNQEIERLEALLKAKVK